MTATMLFLICAVPGGACHLYAPLQPEMSFTECVTGSQAAMAHWLPDHPQWRIARVTCSVGRAAQGAP